MPLVGRAIFAQRPAEDIQRRLVYAPLNASNYYETSATLGQYIVFKYDPDVFEELNRLVDTVVGPNATRQDKEAVQTFLRGLAPPLPARFNEQIETLGNRGERDYTSLIFADLQFIGVMVTDNLTPADRKWWAQNGIIQITTCVQGLATVAVSTGTAENPDFVAYEVFSPLEPATGTAPERACQGCAGGCASRPTLPAHRHDRVGWGRRGKHFTRHYKTRRSLVVDVPAKRGRQRRKLHGNPPRDPPGCWPPANCNLFRRLDTHSQGAGCVAHGKDAARRHERVRRALNAGHSAVRHGKLQRQRHDQFQDGKGRRGANGLARNRKDPLQLPGNQNKRLVGPCADKTKQRHRRSACPTPARTPCATSRSTSPTETAVKRTVVFHGWLGPGSTPRRRA